MSNPDPYSSHPIADGQGTLSLDSWALLQLVCDDAPTFLQRDLRMAGFPVKGEI